jgi:polyribonucleotide nucleotidyltransferase
MAAVEVSLINNAMVINPTKQEKANATLSLVVAGSDESILMIEGQAQFVSEAILLQAVAVAHESILRICKAIDCLQAVAGKSKRDDLLSPLPVSLVNDIDRGFGNAIEKALSIGQKQQRGKAVSIVEDDILAHFQRTPAISSTSVTDAASEYIATDIPVAECDEHDLIQSCVLDPNDKPQTTRESHLEIVLEDEASEINLTPFLQNEVRISINVIVYYLFIH